MPVRHRPRFHLRINAGDAYESLGVRGGPPQAGAGCGAGCGAGMAKDKLTARGIAGKADGRHGDGAGLYLDKRGGAGKWLFRYSLAGQRRDMGLGAWPAVSLAQARAARDRWAAVLADGIDPITERRRRVAAEAEAARRQHLTLAGAVEAAFEARRATLRGDGERGRWLSPLRLHVLPRLGQRPLAQITAADLRDCLRPIWQRLHPTALKCADRLRIVWRHARLAGEPVDPVTVDQAVQLLGAVDHRTEHIRAIPWRDVPALWRHLEAHETVASLCLRWLLLTVVRQAAGRGARLDEIDGDVWTVPADRVKGAQGRAKPFRVPLSPPALALVDTVRPLAAVHGGLLFPGYTGRAITDAATLKALRVLGHDTAPHGFRTAFRSWVQDTEAGGWDVAETALGHTVGGTVERSYARSDLLDRRRELMRAWGDFVTGAAR
jgi:integrase